MTVNMGPQHPSTHGVLRINLELDGEIVVRAIPVAGYLHRGYEKIAESKTFHQYIPYTDRLDYLAPLSNNVSYILAVEKLLGITAPTRAQWIRVMVCELARISAHLLGVGTWALDLGAQSMFFYTFREREAIYNLYEKLTGARMTTSFTRVGGIMADLPDGFLDDLAGFIKQMMKKIDDYERLLTKNRIWIRRTRHIGVIGPAEAINIGLTGPALRGSGVNWDLRRDRPYLVYPELEFDVVVGSAGDVYDRYLMRIGEMRQSLRILDQIVKKIPAGPVNVSDPRISYPPKDRVYSSMEELIYHFKIAAEGHRAPVGEVYHAIENPKGELGFFIAGDGTNHPYRLQIRSPSFLNLQSLPRLCEGHLIADVIAIIGSLDIVLGEIDR
ncbi:MAG TPA: NADH dehydrogenase (quinone) subunit D [Candidatus Eisenbacteria bacterium]